MVDKSNSLTAQERLAISRRALVNQLQGEPPPSERYQGEPQRAGMFQRFAWASVGRNVVERWWRRHPAHAVGQLARPLLNQYAHDKPLKLVATAAATGAVLVLVKPWRLLSVTAVLAAVFKTSDVADVINTLMQSSTRPRKD